MDKLHLLNVFVAVAEEQSFASAARRLSLSPPATTRAVAALEEQLGVKLFTRTTRYVRVTDAGQRYLEDVRRILYEINEADAVVAGINAEPRGHLAVTAPVLFGRMFVIPGIADYLQRYPKMEVSAVFLDRVVNLLEEGFDVGIRIGELPDSSMKAIRVGSVRRVLCTSPEYLSKHGIPHHPADLIHHAVIAASGVTPTVEWKFAQDIMVKVKPRLTVSSNDAAIEAVLLGIGVTRLLSYQLEPYLQSGQLQIILSEFEPARLPIHLIHRENRYASAKVRTFVDLMVEKLRARN
jgi:DNA-binding transcriptional LysR family regulator